MTSQRSSRTSPKHVNSFCLAHCSAAEIVAIDENGRISFNLLQHHRSQAQALLFYAFDVLSYRGINLVNERLSKRREVLGDIMKPLTRKATGVSLSESLDTLINPPGPSRLLPSLGFCYNGLNFLPI